MSWLYLPRVPEPEVMDESGDVEAYAAAAAQAHLERIDDTFVEHALRLVRGHPSGRALDIGTGPGQILLKLACRLQGWHFVGVDRSPNMVAQAQRNACVLEESAGRGFHPDKRTPESGKLTLPLEARVQFSVADGNRLDFTEASFDLVMSNSVLHHLAQPQRVLAEIARVAHSGAAILLRDLRRPVRFAFPFHVRWHGRNYRGTMYRLFCASVRAAYTRGELEELLLRSPLTGARVFRFRGAHIGIERPLR